MGFVDLYVFSHHSLLFTSLYQKWYETTEAEDYKHVGTKTEGFWMGTYLEL
jgi:hypothetical protein